MKAVGAAPSILLLLLGLLWLRGPPPTSLRLPRGRCGRGAPRGSWRRRRPPGTIGRGRREAWDSFGSSLDVDGTTAILGATAPAKAGARRTSSRARAAAGRSRRS